MSVLPIVPVKLRTAGKDILTYAVLDNCSTGTFIWEDVRMELGAERTDTKVLVKTIDGLELHDTKILIDLVVSDVDGNNSIAIPKAFSTDEIIASEGEIPSPELSRKW